MLYFAPLFALGFSQLAMLGWLAAAAVPVLIHLWNKRKYREVTWAAMEYLLAAVQKNSRRLRVEEWLLLAIRIAIILLVVLAVAGPYFEQATTTFVAGRPTHKVFVIDGSYSMAYRATDKSRFDRALELATQIVDQSHQGDAFTLVLMASPPKVIVGTPSQSPRDFLLELQNLKLQHTGADLSATLARVGDVLANAAREQSRLVQHEVYFLTDLGRTTWQPATVATGEVRHQFTQLADLAGLWLVDLGQSDVENLAVTALETNQASITTASELEFRVAVSNFSRTPQRRKIEFLVDDQRMNEETIAVPAAGEATVAFRHRFETAGEHVVETRLAEDGLSVDNRRWLSVPVKPTVETLIVNGESNARSANYLRYALNPDSGHGRESTPIQTTVIAENALLEMDLSRFDCVFCSNVAQFTGGESQALRSYVDAGGALVLFLGNRVLAERYNEVLGGEGPDRLLPVMLDEPIVSSQYSFDPLQYRHPIVAEFRGNEGAGLLQTFISKYYRMRLIDPERSKAQMALGFAETGDPAIVTAVRHRGRVVVVALPASLESVDSATKTPWTLMTATQSFQPIVQEILSWSIGGKMQERNALVGEPIGAVAPAAAADTSLALHTPDGRIEQVRAVVDHDQTQWTFADTWYSGIYESSSSSTGSTKQLFAVNVDTVESDLAKVSPDELPASIAALGQEADVDGTPSAVLSARGGLHSLLLYTALVLLLVESSLAWYLGYRAS